MSHFSRLHDDVCFDERILAAGNAAAGALWRLQAWSSLRLTDGLVAERVARQVCTRAQLRRLLDAELLTAVDGGFQIAWDRQRTRADVEMERYKWRDKEAKRREKAARDAANARHLHAVQEQDYDASGGAF